MLLVVIKSSLCLFACISVSVIVALYSLRSRMDNQSADGAEATDNCLVLYLHNNISAGSLLNWVLLAEYNGVSLNVINRINVIHFMQFLN